MELILSTNAGGKVVSMPKMTPTFFTAAPSRAIRIALASLAIVRGNSQENSAAGRYDSSIIVGESGWNLKTLSRGLDPL
jgi:hypothetical protein